jgi:O-acetyl-ADP-ribose deacetylase (regulator of RNase III)
LGGCKFILWKGDITTLKIDAIVNAANDQLLGCINSNHKCIDKLIHRQSDPRLRYECYKLFKKQNHVEPVGKAKITNA